MKRSSTVFVSTLAGLAIWLVMASPAGATTMRYASLEDLFQTSDLVVRGVVIDHHTFRDDSGHMFTDWTVEVHEVLAGELTPEVTVRQLGGELDGRVLRIPGDGRLAEGDSVLLFLNEEDGVHYLTALGQSVLSVTLDDPLPPAPETIDPSQVLPRGTALRDLSGITFYADDIDREPQLYHIDEPEVLTLERIREMGRSAGGDIR